MPDSCTVLRVTTAVLYARVSTEDQADSGLGLDHQREKLEAMATVKDWNTVYIEDAGYSSKDLDRPGITKALAMLEAGEAEALVVLKLDRLSRSTVDFGRILELATDQVWSLVVLEEAVDTSTASGRLVANVLMSVAQWERETIGERTKAALAQLKSKGVKLGAPVLLDEGVRQRIADERADGRSLRAIADGLTADGVPTARGGRWHASTIKAVLASVETTAVATAGIV